MGGLKLYGTVVIYLSDRCFRQFRYRKYIPFLPLDVDTLDVDFEGITYHVSVMEVICSDIFAETPCDVVVDYLDWYYKVSHPRLVPPPWGKVRHVTIPDYDTGPSYSRLLHISHELRRYLHHHEAEEDDDYFVEVFQALRIARDGSVT